MKYLIYTILLLPKWISIVVLFIYCTLFAEFSTIITQFMQIPASIELLFQIVIKVQYVIIILGCFATWLVITFLFHLMAILCDGKSDFKSYAMVAAFLYFIPAIVILVELFVLHFQLADLHIANDPLLLVNNMHFKYAQKIIYGSFILYYLCIIVTTRYVYKLNWLCAIICVLTPISVIGVVAEVMTL